MFYVLQMCSDLIEDLELLRHEARAIANYLKTVLNFNAWPRYYKLLLLCMSPWDYRCRYFQVQFCIINRIPFVYYLWILQFNKYVGMGHDMPDRLLFKLEQLYQFTYTKALRDGSTCKSYCIFVDSVTDYNGEVVFTNDRAVENIVQNSMPWCDHGPVIHTLDRLGVHDLLFH